ncbi:MULTISPECIES: hypothetical protein [Brevibacillus]|uniref:hypothetical protein n=1 Tax=Brevibacillus TaxID=55080 RepID=UPI0035A6162A
MCTRHITQEQIEELFSEYDYINHDNQKQNKENYNYVDYEVGDIISHRNWGLGHVFKTRGKGDYKELYISFPLRIGKKLLLAKFAPIKKLVLK